jgi:hypothetical protein
VGAIEYGGMLHIKDGNAMNRPLFRNVDCLMLKVTCLNALSQDFTSGSPSRQRLRRASSLSGKGEPV